MATFAETMLANAPPGTITVPASAWATGFSGRPRAPVVVGLRRLSDQDIESARTIAAEKAHKDFACRACEATTSAISQIDAFNDELLCVAVGRGTCLANDVNVPYFDREEDDVRSRMTPEGARFVWEALERLHVMDSPSIEPATDDELLSLGLFIADPDTLNRLHPIEAIRARKLAAHLLKQLRDAPVPET